MNLGYRNAVATLPLFLAQSPTGTDEYYIITDTLNFGLARRMGGHYAPKLSETTGPADVQRRQPAHDVVGASGCSYRIRAKHHMQPAKDAKRMKPDQEEHGLCRH